MVGADQILAESLIYCSNEDKKPGNMYQHLGASDADRKANLEVFKAWVGNWNLKRWKDVTKEELDSLQVNF